MLTYEEISNHLYSDGVFVKSINTHHVTVRYFADFGRVYYKYLDSPIVYSAGMNVSDFYKWYKKYHYLVVICSDVSRRYI